MNRQQEDNYLALLEAIADTAERSQAAAAVLEWVNGGQPSPELFDDMALGLAGITRVSGKLSDDEIDAYNAQLLAMAEAAIALGAAEDDVINMIDLEEPESARAVMNAIKAQVKDDDAAIGAHAVTGGNDGPLLESSPLMLEASVKVVRKGVIKLMRKRPHKMILTSAQKAGLKKARLKAHTATAKISRAISMKVRKRHGL